MKENSRTQNSILNLLYGFVNKFITSLGPFIVRTIFIYKLGNEYLGLNNLFSSILQVLSLSELGFASSFTYCLYKLLAEKDEKKVSALLNYFKKIYRVIGMIIIIAGILIMPFLSHFIKGDYPSGINIYVVYIIFLGNTGLSYFLFSYKNALLNAAQNARSVSKINIRVSVMMYIMQILILLLTSNYYLYILVLPLTTAVNNICVERLSRKLYPEYRAYGKISKTLKKEIFSKIPGLLASSLCSATRTTFDSIFISTYIGLTISGIYSNYFLIISTIAGIFVMLQSAMCASVGNSVATESIQKNYRDFTEFDTIYMIITGWATMCLCVLTQDFVALWIGENNTLSRITVFLLATYFYANRMGDMKAVYNSAAGLWREQTIRSLVETGLNLFLNWLLVYLFGLNGIVSATIITFITCAFLWGSYITFKYYFGINLYWKFIVRHVYQAVLAVVCCTGFVFVCEFIQRDVIGFVAKLIICVLVLPIVIVLLYRCGPYYIVISERGKKIIHDLKTGMARR